MPEPNTSTAKGETEEFNDGKQIVVIVAPIAGVIVLVLVILVVVLIMIRRRRKRQKNQMPNGATNLAFNTEMTATIEEAQTEGSLDSGYSEIQESTERQTGKSGLDTYPQHVSECEFCTIGSVKNSTPLCLNPSCETRRPSETSSDNKYENVPSNRAKVWIIGESDVIHAANETIENECEDIISQRNENSITDGRQDWLDEEKCVSIYYQKALFTEDLKCDPDGADTTYDHTDLNRTHHAGDDNKTESSNIYAHTVNS